MTITPTQDAPGHTPGPWAATPMVKHANNAFYITATPNGNNSEKEVAVVGPCLAETTAANARLIAAAPELVAALEAAEGCILGLSAQSYADRGIKDGTLKTIREAKAKAGVL